jgi:hypothetical protein
MTEVTYNVGATPQDNFVVPFQFWLKDDLSVYVDAVKTEGFTVNGAGAVEGGDIVLNSPISDAVLLIVRTISCARISDFPTYGEFRIEALNAELDRMVAKMCDLEG